MIGAGISFYRQAEQVITLGLQAWYDFSNLASLSLSGSAIISASDKSGNGRTISAPASGNRPTRIPNAYNGRAVAQFDGSFDYMTIGGLSINIGQCSIFVAGKHTPTGPASDLLSIENNAFTAAYLPLLFAPVAAPGAIGIGERFPSNTVVAITAGGALQTFGAVSYRKFADQRARLNNNAYYILNSPGTNPITINNITLGNRLVDFSNPFAGDIGEVLIYDRALDDSEMDFMTSYLINKWGL